MKQLKLRFAQREEAGTVRDWLQANQKQNLFTNPDILEYPTTRVLCSYNGTGPVAYLPFQRVFMLESFAPKPGLDGLNMAQALRDFTKAAEILASGEGIKEIYYLDGEGGVATFSSHHGYDLLPYKVMRMQL